MLLVNIAAGAISQSLIALCNTQWMVYEPSSPDRPFSHGHICHLDSLQGCWETHLGAELCGKLHLKLTKL